MKRKYIGHHRFHREWNDALEAYRVRYRSIEDQLPETARLFKNHDKRQPLHDARVDSISRADRGVVHIELDDRRLDFLGVKECQCPEPLEVGVVWLYHELDLAGSDHFELRALFDEGDFRVIAREIHVFDKHLKRYVVPVEPDPSQPTMFLDRSHGRGRRKK
jgi:hypothetical protein